MDHTKHAQLQTTTDHLQGRRSRANRAYGRRSRAPWVRSAHPLRARPRPQGFWGAHRAPVGRAGVRSAHARLRAGQGGCTDPPMGASSLGPLHHPPPPVPYSAPAPVGALQVLAGNSIPALRSSRTETRWAMCNVPGRPWTPSTGEWHICRIARRCPCKEGGKTLWLFGWPSYIMTLSVQAEEVMRAGHSFVQRHHLHLF